MSLGIYISVPFCRTKCSFCNFASGVFSRAQFARYVDRVCADMARARETAAALGARFEPAVDSVYLGGGTPTVLDPAELARLFAGVRQAFEVLPDAEITVECAPGTLSPAMIDALAAAGVNRASLGVQSFVDQEAASVGRLHTRAIVLEDIKRLRAAGIANLSLDLIAGLPHQTTESWRCSLEETIATGAPHVSVYMLEVDEDSRLGRELIAGGARYHAHFVPDEEATADFYLAACETLEKAGIRQYEISNFARDEAPGLKPAVEGSLVRGPESPRFHPDHPITRSSDLPCFASRHNLRYWIRQPYLGFGVDAHSMLPGLETDPESVRWATPESLEEFLAGRPPECSPVSRAAALEESWFLGLRLNCGVSEQELAARFGREAAGSFSAAVAELLSLGLLEEADGRVRLTARGRLLSNEVFQKFIGEHGQWSVASGQRRSS